MKKVIHILLVAMSFSLCGCAQNHSNQQNNQTSEIGVDSNSIGAFVTVVDSVWAWRASIQYIPNIQSPNVLKAIYGAWVPDNFDFSNFSKQALQQNMEQRLQTVVHDFADTMRIECLAYSCSYCRDSNGKIIISRVKRYMENKEPSDDFLDNYTIRLFSMDNTFITIEDSFVGHSCGVSWLEERHLTFNRNTEEILTIQDVLKKGIGKYALHDILLKYADVEIDTEDSITFPEGKIPIPEYGDFYFDLNSITFVYRKYEIACGAAGIVHITVPWVEIRKYVNKDFAKELGLDI
ncbi:MAG: RsiV family protein [Bacteroidales bacterium]|jgi:hypothetical protein|nr:RsiV family protein [Bacteroidales bacterium]